MAAPIPEDKLAAIKEQLYQGSKVAAVKLHRECTGGSLADSKMAVDALEAQLRGVSPEKFVTRKAATKGCGGILIAVLVLAAIALFIAWFAGK